MKFLNVLIALLSGLLLSFLAYEYLMPTMYYTLPLEATVTNETKKIGIASGSELNFGNLPLGVKARKLIYVNNTGNLPMEVWIGFKGNISSLAYAAPSYFILAPRSSQTVEVGINVSETQSYGHYEGNLTIKGDYSLKAIFLSMVKR